MTTCPYCKEQTPLYKCERCGVEACDLCLFSHRPELRDERPTTLGKCIGAMPPPATRSRL